MKAIPPNHLASRHCTTLHSLLQKMFLKFVPTPLLFLLLCSLSAIVADNDADPTRSTMEQFSGYPTQEPDSVSSFSVDTQGLQKQVWRENFKDCNWLGGMIMWVSVFFVFCFFGLSWVGYWKRDWKQLLFLICWLIIIVCFCFWCREVGVHGALQWPLQIVFYYQLGMKPLVSGFNLNEFVFLFLDLFIYLFIFEYWFETRAI